jgi:hypothetical protein
MSIFLAREVLFLCFISFGAKKNLLHILNVVTISYISRFRTEQSEGKHISVLRVVWF